MSFSDKLDHFTQNARNTFALARDNAIRNQRELITPDDLMFGITNQPLCMGAQIIRLLGIPPAFSPPADHPPDPATLFYPHTKSPMLSSGVKNAIVFAVEEAKSMQHRQVGTEHLLLGLFANSEGVFLLSNETGLTLEYVRAQTLQALAQRDTNDRSNQPADQTSGDGPAPDEPS